jgi:hypothetical protein
VHRSKKFRSGKGGLKPALLLAIACVIVFAAASHATPATSLNSFEAIEEPLVKFFPAAAKFERDSFLNITDQGGGTFRFFLRWNAEWWDGDRDTLNPDRQRAEVKGLGPHQKHGDTFDYTTSWRASPGFRASAGFCHIFQLKAINGDSGLPLITISLRGDKVSVEANSIGPKIIAREFPWKPDTWQTVRIRVRTAPDAEGDLLVSVNGDALEGKSGIVLTRPDGDLYRPKWGLYRRAAVNAPLGDDYIEHKAVTAVNVYEEASDDYSRTSAIMAELPPPKAMGWAETQTSGPVRRDAILKIFSRWADQDVNAAVAWLQQRAPKPELDPVVWLFVTDTTYRYVNRDLALAAAPLIQNSELRAKAFEHVVEIWGRTERAAAISFIEKTPALTAEQKREIVKKLRR